MHWNGWLTLFDRTLNSCIQQEERQGRSLEKVRTFETWLRDLVDQQISKAIQLFSTNLWKMGSHIFLIGLENVGNFVEKMKIIVFGYKYVHPFAMPFARHPFVTLSQCNQRCKVWNWFRKKLNVFLLQHRSFLTFWHIVRLKFMFVTKIEKLSFEVSVWNSHSSESNVFNLKRINCWTFQLVKQWTFVASSSLIVYS